MELGRLGKRTRIVLHIALVFAASLSSLAGPRRAVSAEEAGFVEREVFSERSTLRFFDLGVTDINGDGLLDVYTSNHSDLQSLWVNRGDWRFEDRLKALGLHQDARHPGLESLPTPATVQPGSMRMYWQRRWLVLETNELSNPETYAAKLTFFGDATIKRNAGFEIRSRKSKAKSQWPRTVITIRPPRSGKLEIMPKMVPAPIRLDFEDTEAARHFYLGRSDTPLEDQGTSFQLRDRHGMAWADVDDDGDLDVFIARGGLKGEMIDAPFELSDELLLQTGQELRDASESFGLRKPYSRARKAMWADFDLDGLPDLLVTSLDAPAQVLLRRKDRFVDSGKRIGIASIRTPIVAVANVFGDAAPEILAGDAFGLTVYRVRSDIYRGGIPVTDSEETRKIIIGDVDGDGDLDALAVSADSMLLVNGGDSFEATSAASVGLPADLVEANWVDYDNDGDLDIFVIPGGLYAQTAPLSFERTPHFPHFEDQELAYSAWADLDNDGDSDLVLAIEVGQKPRYWRVHAYENRLPPTQWLQVALKGPPGNPQALGAVVTVKMGECEQTRRVGEFEGAHFSQGHYRIYFGLADCKGSPALRVSWPNGKSQSAAANSNEFVRIHYAPN